MAAQFNIKPRALAFLKALTVIACGFAAGIALAQADSGASGLIVSIPNGYASVTVEDMRLASSAGPVRWLRVWDGKEWKFNPHWESLSQSWTNLTGAQTGTPTAGAMLAAPTDSSAGCWVMVDEDWQPQKGTVLIDNRPPFPPMQSERTAPFNKVMGEDEDDYPPPRVVSVDYASLCKGIPLLGTPVRDLEAVRLKNELYMGENGRYAYSNRAFLEKRAVRGLPVTAATVAQLASGSITLAPVETPKGYRWLDKAGEWIDYNVQGQVVAYGDKNNNVVWMVRDSGGLLRGVVDAAGRVLLTLHYTGKLITEVRDYPIAGNSADLPARSARYAYDAGNRLTSVTDVRGNKIGYDYDAANHLTSITDQEGRVTQLDYAGSSVKRKTAPDGTVTDYLFDYDDVNKQFTSRVSGPETLSGRRVDDYTHNRSGQLVRHMVNGQLEQEVRYDTGARAEMRTNARGYTSTVVLNEYGQVVQFTAEDGTVVKSTYSAQNLSLLDSTDARGSKTVYQNDALGNILSITEASGTSEQRVTRFENDAYGQVIKMTKVGRTEVSGSVTPDAVSTGQYNAIGKAATWTDAEGGQRRFEYNRLGELVRITNPRNFSTTFAFNAHGQPTSLTNPLAQSWHHQYDKVGNTTALTDPKQFAQTQAFDALNRLIEASLPQSGKTLIKYNPAGMPTEFIDADGNQSRIEYDPLQRPSTYADGMGNTTRFSYQIDNGTSGGVRGSMGGPTEIMYPTYAERRRYDELERPTTTTLSGTGRAASASTIQYDSAGLPVRETDAYGKNKSYQYDALGNIISVTDELSHVTRFQYDVRGNLTEVKDANGKLRRYEYDRNNRVVKEVLPLGQSSALTYDPNGNLATYQGPNGDRRAFTYDAADRLTEVHFYDKNNQLERHTTYGYSSTNQIATWTDEAGGQINSAVISYDAADRKTGETVTYAGGFSMSYGYGYSSGGKKTALRWPDGSEIGYAYSQHGILKEVAVPGEGTISVSKFNWLQPAAVTLPGGTTEQRSYDALLNPTDLAVTGPGLGSLLELHAEYGARNEPTKKTRSDFNAGLYQSEAFSYDAAMRLTRVDADAGTAASTTHTFGLDPIANRVLDSRISGSWQYDDNQRLVRRGSDPASMVSYAYDDAGNLIRKTEPGGVVTHFTYDVRGRLTQVTLGTRLVARYGYDPLGRRLWKEQFADKNGQVLPQALRTYFLYADEGLIAEASQDITLHADASVTSSGTARISTQYGPRPGNVYSGAALFVKTRNSDGVDVVAYYHHDERNAPVQASDRNGAIVWAARYDAFGRATVITPQATPGHPTIASLLRLPGQYEDTETGLHYNMFRDYDPDTGRYLESDPIGLRGGVNTYAYVLGNPMWMVDPEGLDGIYDFARGAGSYFRGVYRVVRHVARSYGLMGKCEKARAAEEDIVMYDIIDELRNNPQARDKAKEEAAKWFAKNGTYMKGRITAGVAVSVKTPYFLGPVITAGAIYGDTRYAIEQGADTAESIIGGMGGNAPIKNPRASSTACECKQ